MTQFFKHEIKYSEQLKLLNQKISKQRESLPNFLDQMAILSNFLDELKDCQIDHLYQIPKIVVVGSQSSGKSSLVEFITGKDFLERGNGTVTRRPLELRLRKNRNEDTETIAQFHQEDKKYTNFDEVRNRITQLTIEEAGGGKKIIKKPIILNVIGPDCPDLTIIDLPGVTLNKIPGSDMPDNIYELTSGIVKDYISQESTIILAVAPANDDIGNALSLKLAREVDPKGERTLGVLTKIDIMDKGVSCIDILKNKAYPLKHGFIGVKGRNQEDILANISVKQGLQKEITFFSQNQFKEVDQMTKTHNLTHKLTKLIYDKIIRFLPTIREGLQKSLIEQDQKLEKLGSTIPTDEESQELYYRGMLSRFCCELLKRQKGVQGDTGPAFKTLVDQSVLDMHHDLREQQIKVLDSVTVANLRDDLTSYPRRISGIFSDVPIIRRLQELMPMFRPIVEKQLKKIREMILNATRTFTKEYFEKFEYLSENISKAIVLILDEYEQDCLQKIKDFFDIETSLFYSCTTKLYRELVQIRKDPDQILDVNSSKIRDLVRISGIDEPEPLFQDAIPKNKPYPMRQQTQDQQQTLKLTIKSFVIYLVRFVDQLSEFSTKLILASLVQRFEKQLQNNLQQISEIKEFHKLVLEKSNIINEKRQTEENKSNLQKGAAVVFKYEARLKKANIRF